jgi:hypothetical protein
MATFFYYQYGELTGTTLTRVEVTHRVCGAETFTPRDPDIIEAHCSGPPYSSGPTRGGQENCVVNGAVSGSALPSVVPTTVGLVEGDRTTTI